MKISSHNSWSYNRPKKTWMRMTKFAAKCQNLTIKEQYDLGVRCFDLRVRFDDLGQAYVCHGLIEYETRFWDDLSMLNQLSKEGDEIYIRVMLEDLKNTEDKESQFFFYEKFCDCIEHVYANLKFWGGWCKYEWRDKWCYHFKTKEPKVIELYSSVTGTVLDDLYPYYYAKRNNKINRKRDMDCDFLMIDFIEI